jgi:hypothetical protein
MAQSQVFYRSPIGEFIFITDIISVELFGCLVFIVVSRRMKITVYAIFVNCTISSVLLVLFIITIFTSFSHFIHNFCLCHWNNYYNINDTNCPDLVFVCLLQLPVLLSLFLSTRTYFVTGLWAVKSSCK